MNATAKFDGGPITPRRLLEPVLPGLLRSLDGRWEPRDPEPQAPPETEIQRYEEMGAPMGRLSPEELERAYAELHPDEDPDAE